MGMVVDQKRFKALASELAKGQAPVGIVMAPALLEALLGARTVNMMGGVSHSSSRRGLRVLSLKEDGRKEFHTNRRRGRPEPPAEHAAEPSLVDGQ